MSSVLEIAEFKITGNEADFVAGSADINTWLDDQPGFKYRQLVKREDGVWVDLVTWADLETAQAAGAKFMQELANSPFMQMIDPESVVMHHAPILSAKG